MSLLALVHRDKEKLRSSKSGKDGLIFTVKIDGLSSHASSTVLSPTNTLVLDERLPRSQGPVS